MNREEAIDRLKGLFGNGYSKQEEALNMAIKALEQQPCDMKQRVEKEYLYESLCEDLKKANAEIKRLSEPCDDTISRQAVCKIIDDIRDCVSVNGYWAFLERLKKLPSVNPTKTGHWEQYGNSWEDKFKCSECGKEQPKILCGERIIGHWSDYCPNCGAWMVEPQERSDKE